MGRDELCSPADHFAAGEWFSLIEMARSVSERPAKGNAISEKERRGKAAQNRVRRGQVSRARHELKGAATAPPMPPLQSCKGDVIKHQSNPSPGKCWKMLQTKFSIWNSKNSSSASEHLLLGAPRVPAGAPMN